MRTLSLLTASVRDLGLAATVDQLPGLLLSPLAMRRLKRRKLAELSRDGFDATHGTDTAGILAGRELGPCVTRAGHVVIPYETTSEAAIRMALDGLGADFSRSVFVDLGCGKGKPLMVAASYPFRRLIGVDVSPACIAVARRNLARYGPDRDRSGARRAPPPGRRGLRVPRGPPGRLPLQPVPRRRARAGRGEPGGQPPGVAATGRRRLREPSRALGPATLRAVRAGADDRRQDAAGGAGDARPRARRGLRHHAGRRAASRGTRATARLPGRPHEAPPLQWLPRRRGAGDRREARLPVRLVQRPVPGGRLGRRRLGAAGGAAGAAQRVRPELVLGQGVEPGEKYVTVGLYAIPPWDPHAFYHDAGPDD